MTTAAQLLGQIEAYCRRTKTAETTFGREAVNDGKLVSRLRAGRSITLDTVAKIEAALSEDQSVGAESPPAANNQAAH